MNRLALTLLLAATVLAGCSTAPESVQPPLPEQQPVISSQPVDTSEITHMSPAAKRERIDPTFMIEVPVPDGEVTRARAQGDSAWDFDITVDAPPAELAQWYREAYAGRGWEQIAEEIIGDRVTLTFRKGGAQSRIEMAVSGDAPTDAAAVIGVGTEVLQTQ